MKNFVVSSLIVGFLVFGYGIAIAQEAEEREVDGGVTIEDLDVAKPRLLPTSPFYFFKEWRRGIQRFFTFNSVAKTKLELKFVNEKVAELKIVEERKGDDAKSLEKALQNYDRSVRRLQERFVSLDETSENPRVDALLDLFADRSLRHQQLLEELKSKRGAFEEAIEKVRDKLDEVSIEVVVKFDSPEKFKLRFQKAIKEQKEGVLKEFKYVHVLDRFEEDAPEKFREKISELKEDLILKFEGRFRVEPSDLWNALSKLSFARADELEVFDEIRERISDSDLKSILNVVRQEVLEFSENGGVGEQEASDAIERAKELSDELEEKVGFGEYSFTQVVIQLLERARHHIEQAEKFYTEGQYGLAFGQATAARATAKNGLSQLVESDEELEEDNQLLRLEFDDLVAEARERNVTRESDPELFDLFDEAEKVIVGAETVEEIREAKVKLAEPEVFLENVLESGSEEARGLKITITGQGFLPRELKIKKGDTVTWVNESSRASWPASALHPTHTVYPDSSIRKCGTDEQDRVFDACRGVEAGELWAFTFNEAGKWGYHDHLSASKTGVVVVE